MNNILSKLSKRSWNLLGFLFCMLVVGYALYTQHFGGLDPCNLCIFQRIAFIALGLVFLLAAMHNPQGKGRFAYGLLGLIAGGTGIAIAGRHVWLQRQPPDPFAGCGGDLQSLLDTFPLQKVVELVLRGSGDCSTIDWTLFGITMPGWSLISISFATLFLLLVNLRK